MSCSKDKLKDFYIFSCMYFNRDTFQSCKFPVNCVLIAY